MALPLLIKRATKAALKLRMALTGPSGSGKTMTALKIAFGLIGIDITKIDLTKIDRSAAAKVLVVDTESRSAEKYAHEFPQYDCIQLEDDFAPERFIECIDLAVKEGYEVLILDSLTHEWKGKGGVLDLVDAITTRNRGDNKPAWREMTPRHDALFRKIVEAKIHIIATFRAKQHIAVERDATGKTKTTKLGLAAETRDGAEYEFDVTCDIMKEGNKLTVDKSRCSAITSKVYPKAGFDVASALIGWLGTSEAVQVKDEQGKKGDAGSGLAEAAGIAETGKKTDTTGNANTDTNAGGTTNAEAAERQKLTADVGAIINGRDDRANETFRAKPAKGDPWITPEQTWKDLPLERLKWVIANKAKFEAKLAEPVKAAA